MNTLTATITSIDTHESLSLAHFDYHGNRLLMMSLELHETIARNAQVVLGFKATAVGVAHENVTQVSYSNQIKARLVAIDTGKLLSRVHFEVANDSIQSVITRASQMRLDLQVGGEYTLLIKSSDIAIIEVL